MSQVSRFPARLPRSQDQTNVIWEYFFPPEFTTIALVLILISPILLAGGYTLFKWSIEPQQNWGQVGPPPTTPLIVAMFGMFMPWGFISLTAGVWLMVKQRTARPKSTDLATIDHLLRRDLDLVKARSLKKIEMRLSSSDTQPQSAFQEAALAEPQFWLSGCLETDPVWGRLVDAKTGWRQGPDQNVRFLINRVAILVLAEHHLAYYLCDFNLATGLILKEEVVDCHYKDVHMISYLEKKIHAADALQARPSVKVSPSKNIDLSSRGLQISIGGTSIEIPLGIRPNGESFEADSMVDPIVSRIRFLLREKRRSYVRLAGSPAAS